MTHQREQTSKLRPPAKLENRAIREFLRYKSTDRLHRLVVFLCVMLDAKWHPRAPVDFEKQIKILLSEQVLFVSLHKFRPESLSEAKCRFLGKIAQDLQSSCGAKRKQMGDDVKFWCLSMLKYRMD